MKEFKLETILTIITGVNLTDKFNEIYEFAYYIYDDNFLSTSAIMYLKNDMAKHILETHPELNKIGYIPISPFAKNIWINDLKQKYGETLTIPKMNKRLIKNKTK